MGFLSLMLLSFGAFGISLGSKCVPETAKCSTLWVRTQPHKNLMASERELNLWCRQHSLFMKCLEDVLLEGKNGNLSYLPTNLLISKLFAEDLCIESSTSRHRLLDNAACINDQNTEYCSHPEYYDIVTPDNAIPPSRSSQSEMTFSCIASTIVLNCGFDAGRVYRSMLKITRYSEEVCGIETTGNIPAHIAQESNYPKREKLSEVYYGLVHKIGSIPQEEYLAVNIPDEESRINNEAVTEAIRSALDSLDRDTVVDYDVPERPYRDLFPPYYKPPLPKREPEQYKPYMKTPVITKLFGRVLFYNYSGIEYSVYWRQPDFVRFDNITCDQYSPAKGLVFVCMLRYRFRDPYCVSNDTVFDELTPELIRELDPEVPDDSITDLGPLPEWTEVYNLNKPDTVGKVKSTSMPLDESDSSSVSTTAATLLHAASSISSTGKKWRSDQNILPFDDKLMDWMQPETFVPPPISTFSVGDIVYVLFHDSGIANLLENATCSRLDECHPKGRGLWKCRSWKRQRETCSNCDNETDADNIDLSVGYARFSREKEQSLEVPDMENSVIEGSGELEDILPTRESIELVLENDVLSASDMYEFIYDVSKEESNSEISSEDGPTDKMSVSEEQMELEPEYTVDKNDIHLLVLDNLLESEGNSDLVSKLVYAIDGIEIEENESEDISANDGIKLLEGSFLTLMGNSNNFNEYTIDLDNLV